MFFLQIGISFAIWVGLGAFAATKQPQMQARFAHLGRTTRVLLGAAFMIGCLLFLFGPLLWMVKSGGLTGGPMSGAVWAVVTLSGLFFVGANTVSLNLLVSVAREAAVTERASQASSRLDLDS
jgi:hypothetical protein